MQMLWSSPLRGAVQDQPVREATAALSCLRPFAYNPVSALCNLCARARGVDCISRLSANAGMSAVNLRLAHWAGVTNSTHFQVGGDQLGWG